MRRWWLPLALLLSLGINAGILATLSVARWRERPPLDLPGPERPGAAGGGGGPAIERVADRLELAAEPRQRFLAIQRRFFEETREERFRLERSRADLRREILAREPDRARVDELLTSIGRSTAALDRALVRNVLDSRAVLDERQERLFLRFVVSRLRQPRLERPFRPGPRRPLRDPEGPAEEPPPLD